MFQRNHFFCHLKKLSFFVQIFFFLLCFLKNAWAEKVLLVSHPTVAVLQTVLDLKNNFWAHGQGNDLRLIGIYHSQETEDYQLSEQWLKDHPQEHIELLKMDCPLRREDLYNSAACHESYKKILEKASGLYIGGGPDMPPEFYGEKTKLSTFVIHRNRHQFQLSLLAYLFGNDKAPNVKPFMADHPDFTVVAICLGFQTLNVAMGGSLTQDIAEGIYHVHTLEQGMSTDSNQWHRQWEYTFHYGWVLHPARLQFCLQSNQLGKPWCAKQTIEVLSSHHQALHRLAKNLQVIATSTDGKVIEGVKHKVYPHVVGWQFHPEQDFLFPEIMAKKTSTSYSAAELLAITQQLQLDPQSLVFHHSIWHTIFSWLQNAPSSVTSEAVEHQAATTSFKK